MPRRSNQICELTILGSGSGIPVIDRASSATLVNAGGRLHLLDCGEGITSTLLERKIPCNRIETILITHGHPDHCSGLPLLLQLMHVNKRERELKIFLPEEALDPTMRYLWH
ncbi:MAG: MBL fold metallo-hydrolase, partial [candidate division Zixibacteria bacterium]|nr:MBL fold metallo-hydrolase [candidate division Zixibacteria bacterium]